MTLEALAECICGQSKGYIGGESQFVYRKMWEIRDFFKRCGIVPKGDSGTRKWYVVESLEAVNGTNDLDIIVSRLVSPVECRGDQAKLAAMLDELNQFLAPEGLRVAIRGVEPVIERIDPTLNQLASTNPRIGSLESSSASNSDEVFVIYGRNEKARLAIFEFLRAIGLRPLEWSHVVANSGLPSPSIPQLLQQSMSRAAAFVVLLTPDEKVRLDARLLREGESEEFLTGLGQARQNVLFEAGMAVGVAPNRTVFVELGETRPFTDIAGIHKVTLDDSVACRQNLAHRIRLAGCSVDLCGTDWHHAGNFQGALEYQCATAADAHRLQN